MTRVAFYVDSHGFGHASRSVALAEAFPPAEFEILFRTNVPTWLLEENGIDPAAVVPSPLDLHPVQSRGYRIDAEKSHRSAVEKLRASEGLVRDEVVWLKENRVDLVVSDISPLALRAGARAGLPTFGVGNFTWDWIFESLVPEEGLSETVVPLREMMAEATLNFRLPFSEEEAFPAQNSIETPLLSRNLKSSRKEARAHFRFLDELRYVLLTFGGFGIPTENFRLLERYSPLQFVFVAPPATGSGEALTSPRLTPSPEAGNLWRLEAPLLHHVDLVNAVDALLAKPGYGTLSEAMSTDTPMVLDTREDFREFESMRRDLTPYPQVAFVDHEQILQLNVEAELARVLEAAPLPWQGGTDGAEFIVERILDRL